MKVLLVYLILCIIWSSTWIFIKIGLDDLPPVSFAAVRFLIAAGVLLIILAAQKISFPKERRFWILAGVTGLMQFAINYALVFWAEKHISSGLAAVLQATIPAFGLVLAQIYVPGEKITLLKVFAILLGIIGVSVIFYEQLNISGVMALLGCAGIVLGAFFAAYASVLTKAFGTNLKVNTTALLTAQMICGLVPLTLVGVISEGNPLAFNWSAKAIICVLYLALLGSVAAFLLYYWLLRKIEVTKAMMISLITPFAAVLIGSLYANETLQWQTLAGGALILFSVGLILFQPKKKLITEDAKDTEEEMFSNDNSIKLCQESIS
jgi:drug/metabolite transporter (DMT)-like permease